jgi:hypothetical protein
VTVPFAKPPIPRDAAPTALPGSLIYKSGAGRAALRRPAERAHGDARLFGSAVSADSRALPGWMRKSAGSAMTVFRGRPAAWPSPAAKRRFDREAAA